MSILDIRSILFIGGLFSGIICVLVIGGVWIQNRKRFSGLAFWFADFVFQMAAFFLIALRGVIHDGISIVLSNTLVIAGALLGYLGLERFVGKRSSQIHNYILLAAFPLIHGYFAFVQPNLTARNLNVSIVLFIICFQCLWLMLRRVGDNLRPLTRWIGMIFGAYCLTLSIRMVLLLIYWDAKGDYLRSGVVEGAVMIVFQMLLVLLAFGMVMIVNKRLLMDLEKQEEKFFKAFHSSPYAVTLTRLSDGEIFEVNDGFVNMMGYSHGEVLGKSTADLNIWCHEGDRARVVHELSRDGKIQAMELPFRKKSGEILTGLYSAEIIAIDNEKSILASINDISKRKRAEEALKESENRVNLLINSTAEAIYGIDLQGNCTFANPSCLKMLGYADMDQLLGKNMHHLIHHSYPDGHPMQMEDCKIYQAFRNRRQMHVDDEVLWRADGQSFPAEYWSYPQVVDGVVCGAVVTFIDITDRKKAEENLRRSEEKYRTILENIAEGYFESDLEGNVVFVNDSACEMMGCAKEDLYGKNYRQFTTPATKESIQKTYGEVLRTGLTSKMDDYEIIRKDGVIRVHQLIVGLMRNAAGQPVGFRSMARDVTERRQAEKEREKLIADLQKALADIKTLSGLLPICSSCKKIRNDKGYWERLESYIGSRSEAVFSHGICPECARSLYPELYKDP